MKFVLVPPGEFMTGSTSAEIEAALKDPAAGQFFLRRRTMSLCGNSRHVERYRQNTASQLTTTRQTNVAGQEVLEQGLPLKIASLAELLQLKCSVPRFVIHSPPTVLLIHRENLVVSAAYSEIMGTSTECLGDRSSRNNSRLILSSSQFLQLAPMRKS